MMARVALYLQDSHDLRDGLDYVAMRKRKGLKPYGRPKAAWCAMRLCQWPLTPP